MSLPYTHAKLAAMEQQVKDQDIEALILEQIEVLHLKICNTYPAARRHHDVLTTGINKNKCRYCLRRFAAVIEPGPGPGPGP